MVLVVAEFVATADRTRAAAALLVSLGAVVASVAGVLAYRPPARPPWLVVAGAMMAFAAGNAVWLVTGDPLGGGTTGLVAINVAKLVAFLLLIAAAVLSVAATATADGPRSRRPRRRGRLVDACLIGLTFVLLTLQWVDAGDRRGALLGAPGFGEVAVAIGSLGIVVVIVVATPAFWRSALSARLLVVALILGTFGNAVELLGAATGSAWSLTPLLAATALTAAAALHPSMVRLAGAPMQVPMPPAWEPPPRTGDDDTDSTVQVRTALMIVLVATALVLPVVDLLSLRGASDQVGRTVVTSLIALVMLGRIAWLASSRDRLASKLSKVSRRFEALVAHHAEATVVVGDDGLIRYASPATSRVLDPTVVDCAGMPLERLAPPPTGPGVRSIAEAALRTGQDGPVTSTAQVETASGSVRDIEVTVADLRTVPSVRGKVLHLRDVTQQVRLQDRLRVQALTDALTGLPNRVLFSDRVEQAVRRAERERLRIGVVMVDLDGFKNINDALGHAAGDELLVACAQRLTECMRPSDTCARLGGDEFAVLLDGDVDDGDAVAVAGRMAQVLRRPFALAGTTATVCASLGVAVSEGAHAPPRPDALVRDADIAMYVAKRAGGDRVELFRPVLRTLADARLDVQSTLPEAIAAGEIEVHFQPIVRMHDLSITGVEALVRWRRNGELLTPDRFLGIAEERDDLIRPLGIAVLEQACRTLAATASARPLDLHVNVSPRQVATEGLITAVKGAVDASGFGASSLVLELTESGVLDQGAAGRTLSGLRSLGVRVAIDDFGTGYSNLQRLRQLDIDILKLDRSLVADLTDPSRSVTAARVVEAVRSVADTMGAVTLAEGVEQSAQRQVLLELGCELGQGYLFGHPAPELRVPDPAGV